MEALATLATVPAILALVNLGKRFGLTGPWAALAAVILGVVLSVFDVLFGANVVYAAAATGLLTGLGAAGLYDLAKAVTTGQAAEERLDEGQEPDDQAIYPTAGRGLSASAAKLLGR